MPWLSAGLVAAWWPWAMHVWMEWEFNPQYGYGWTVPALALYIFWVRWTAAPAGGKSEPSRLFIFFGVCLLVVVLAMRWLSMANPDWRLLGWVLGLCASALTIMLAVRAGGLSWGKWFLFPALFPLIATPLPSGFEMDLIQLLTRWVTIATVEVVNLAGVPALVQGNLIHLSNGVLGVDAACSGIRSLQGSMMAALFLGEFYFLRVGARIGMFASAIVLAMVLNTVRSIWLVMEAHRNGVEAVDVLHDQAGWTLFAILFVILFLMGAWIAKKTGVQVPPHTSKALHPLLIRNALMLVLGVLLIECGSRVWFAMRGDLRDGTHVQWQLDVDALRPGAQPLEIAADARRMLRYDDAESYAWHDEDGSYWRLFIFSWDGGKAHSQLAQAHAPDVCLPAAGMRPLGTSEAMTFSVSGNDFSLERSAYESGGQVLEVFHGIMSSASPTTPVRSPWSWQSRISNAWNGVRHPASQVFLLGVSNVIDSERLPDQLSDFVQSALQPE